MFAAGCSLEEIGDYVGHSSTYMTDRHRHRGCENRGVRETQLEDFVSGLTPVTQGWFVVNVRDAEWWFAETRGARCAFENEYGEPPVEFAQLGINVTVLDPGQTTLYHAEANQEAFLVVTGECALIVEEEERRLRPWDFFHAPPWTEHAFVGAGDGPCVILMVGARSGPGVQYPASELAARHGASVAERPPTGGRRTRQSSGSGESARQTGLVSPGRKAPRTLRNPALRSIRARGGRSAHRRLSLRGGALQRSG